MSLLVGGGLVAVIAIGYVGRKSWFAFHRAVGITPGKMRHIEAAKLPPPTMIELTLDAHQLSNLPSFIVDQLVRIDVKASAYQKVKSQLIQIGQTPATFEDEFVIGKLLNTRLPEMVDSYQRILSQKEQGSNVEILNQATSLLTELLQQTEKKLDELLNQQQNKSLQDMQAMQRYLKDR